MKKLTKAIEAFKYYKGRDENPPEKKQKRKPLRLLPTRRKQWSLSLPRCSSYIPTYLRILGEQIDVILWTNLFGVKHAEKRHRSLKSFMDCVTFHLLTVFQRGFLELCGRDPAILYQERVEKAKQGANLWQFVQRVQQLYSYLDILLCLVYSMQASSPRRWSHLIMPT